MRPALADVVAVLTGDRALTEFWRVALKPYEPPARIFNRVEVSDRGVATFDVIEGLKPFPRVAFQRWAHSSSADALAALVEAELLPEHWLRPVYAPGWWCEGCDGTGYAAVNVRRGRKVYRCGDCDIAGYIAAPPRADLVAVASLGADALARAEAIVAEEWRGRVVWRVMEAGAIVRHHELTARDGDGHSPAYVFSHEQERARRPHAYGGQPAWPVECPWTATMQSESTWRALRAIALTEDGNPTGLHLLAVEDGRVALGVEALDG